MRGSDEGPENLFSYVSCEARVHPLRPIRAIVDEAWEVLSAEFDRMYAPPGRPLVAPEKLLRALLLQAFYSVSCSRANIFGGRDTDRGLGVVEELPPEGRLGRTARTRP
jgi:hypothetical protein